MDAHPLAERYPLMEGAEFESFQADIKVNGCKNYVWTFQGKILDGRNRYRACQNLGIEPKYAEFDGTEEEAELFVDSQNMHRRHLTADFRKQRVAELRAQGMSMRKIAEAVGTSLGTVQNDLREGVQSCTPEPPAEVPLMNDERFREKPQQTQEQDEPVSAKPPKVTGRDGKQYPATKPTPASKPEPQDERNRKSLGKGVQIANEAINLLARIPKNDALRKDGLQHVLRWVQRTLRKL